MQIISVLPNAPTVGGSVTVNSQIQKVQISGLEQFIWSVTRDGNAVSFVPDQNPDAREILFTVDQAGLYEVVLMGTVGGTACTDASQTVMAAATGANNQTYRLRVIPASTIPAPVHEQVIPVVGGTDNNLGVVSLSQGVLATGTVTSPTNAPTGAYLRASEDGEIIAEAFATADGAFSLRMPFGVYDVLVVPFDVTAAPLRVSQVASGSLSDIGIPSADTITGTVRTSGGSAVGGATVALSVGGVPSTLGASDGSGGFSVLARAGAGVELSVDSADPTRPDLVASVGSIAAGAAIDVQYSAGLSTRNFGFDVVGSDGLTPLPGARVVFAARPIAAAGTIRIDGGAPIDAEGRARVSVTADGTGSVASVALPDAIYDVFVEAPDGSGEVDAWLILDLGQGEPSPAQLSLSPAGTVTGHVVGDSGAAIADAVVSAVPAGTASTGVIATTTAVTATNGSYSLALSPGVAYDVSIDAGNGSGYARARDQITAPSAGANVALPDQQLPAAVSVYGEVVVSGLPSAGAGAQVTLFCDGCTGVDAIVPVAEAIADLAGQFELVVPDPGVD